MGFTGDFLKENVRIASIKGVGKPFPPEEKTIKTYIYEDFGFGVSLLGQFLYWPLLVPIGPLYGVKYCP